MKINHYDHIIWDWNGTLLDDAHLCVDILNGLMRTRNLSPTTPQQYQEEFDFPVKNYYERMGFDFSKESFDTVATEFIVEYDRRRFQCPLQESAVRTLEAIRSEGLSQSVLSAYQQHRLTEIIEYFGLTRFFTHLVGLNDHYAASKVELGRLFVEDFHIAREKILLVGDTTHDFEVAKSAGIHCVLIPSGHHSLKKLQSCGVDVFPDLGSLMVLCQP
jgi:phosphoglycolate phosphatase